MSTVTEKIVLRNLLAYLTGHNLICPSEVVFRPHHSTETALFRITYYILLASDSGNVFLLTLLNLSAAFDTTDHCILLNRFHHMYGISGTHSPVFFLVFFSYLTNRAQSAIVDDRVSQVSNIFYGVPQGSVLGPIPPSFTQNLFLTCVWV